MADNLQLLTSIVLAQSYRGDVVRQVNRKAITLSLLPCVPGAGKNVAFVPEGSGVVAEMYLEGADAENFGSDAQGQALLPWAMARSNFHLSGLAEATAATSSTPEGDIALWARNVTNGAAAVASLINGEIFTGSGAAPHMVGLDKAIGLTNNTYAGIDRTDGANAFWLPNKFAPVAPTSLSFDLIRGDQAAIYIASGARPDIAPIHPNVMRKLQSLFDGQKQFVMNTKDTIMTARGQVKLDGGGGAVYFEGTYFVEDKDATDGKIYYLSSDHVRIEYLPVDLSAVPGLEDEAWDVPMDDGYGMVPLGLRAEMLAKAGDSNKASLKSYLQLVVEKPNACGVRSNIA